MEATQNAKQLPPDAARELALMERLEGDKDFHEFVLGCFANRTNEALKTLQHCDESKLAGARAAFNEAEWFTLFCQERLQSLRQIRERLATQTTSNAQSE